MGALERLAAAYEELDNASLLEEASDKEARDPRYLDAKATLERWKRGRERFREYIRQMEGY